MRKIAFFDIDGTLVNVPNGMFHPSDATRSVIKKFQDQGHYIVVATARNQIPESVRDVDFDGYICSDGHYVEFHGKQLINHIFSDEEIAMQLAIYEEYNGSCVLGGYSGNWTSSHTDQYLKQHQAIYFGSDDLTRIPLVANCMGSIEANLVTAVFSCSDDLFAAKAKLPESWTINAYGNDIDVRMDVHLDGFSKGTACEFLFNHLGIDRSQTYAFGDGQNDIEMLQLVGTGIAMGNASDKVKASADIVTDTVDNDGIAKAFKTYLSIEI